MRSSLTALFFFLLAISACATPHRRPEPDNLSWPLPPDKPRIKYVQSIYNDDDIGHVYSLKEKLFGKAYIDTMARPYGVFARRGRVYVTDIVAMRVMVYDLALKHAASVGDERAIRVPSSVVAGSSGVMYVADAAQAKIGVYDPQGQYRTAFLLQHARPVALALNEHLGRLYVVDRNGHKVVVLNLDGTVLFEFGAHGTEDGQFNMPLDLTVDGSGRVYVLDSGNFRVQIFDANGKFLHKFGAVGDRPGFFANPKGIAVDSDEHIYVTDAAFSNFQIFDQEGNVLLFIGALGSGPGDLSLPAGISIDESDRIYVADQLNRRLAVFQYLKGAD